MRQLVCLCVLVLGWANRGDTQQNLLGASLPPPPLPLLTQDGQLEQSPSDAVLLGSSQEGNTGGVDGDSGIIVNLDGDTGGSSTAFQTNEVSNSVAKQSPSTSFGPVSSPFFFLCQYPRPGEPSGVREEDISITAKFTGTRNLQEGYEPHAVYEVLVSANVVFDGFLVTGVHALNKQLTTTNYLALPTSLHGGASEGLACAVLHSHISDRPRSQLSFLWMAPPPGTGCVAFLAQGSLRGQILFKDLNILEVCQKDDGPGQLQVRGSHFTGLNQQGYVFRDDFDGHQLNAEIWSDMQGGEVSSRDSNHVLHGGAVTFTQPDAALFSAPMDLSNGRQLQFVLGPGSCIGPVDVELVYGLTSPDNQAQFMPPSSPTRYQSHGSSVSAYTGEEGSGDGHLVVIVDNTDNPSTDNSSNGDSNLILETQCSSWQVVHTYRVEDSNEVHTQPIPEDYRVSGVCVGWRRRTTVEGGDTNTTNTCWGLDNIALTTAWASHQPLHDDFDPVDPANWMFFPGAAVKEWCGSEGNSLVFRSEGGGGGGGDGVGGSSWATTRLMDLRLITTPPLHELLLDQQFLHSPPTGWDVAGGVVKRCEGRQGLIFSQEGDRRLCTPYLDARNVGVVSLWMSMVQCEGMGGEQVTVRVYRQQEGEVGEGEVLGEDILTSTRPHHTFPLQPHLQTDRTRFCVAQSEVGVGNWSTWVVETVRLLPWLPADPQHYFQARVNLECGEGVSQVDVESSSDGGSSWTSLHRHCLPGACTGAHSAITSALHPDTVDRWGLVTLPLPYMALTPHTRLRVRQLGAGDGTQTPEWALDSVYVGPCPKGCSGRGLCQPHAPCKCQYGFRGEACQLSDIDNPLYVSEPFTSTPPTTANILKMSGGGNSFRCGVVGSGTAGVFSGRGRRYLTTVDVNTTTAHLLQFHFLAGTVSDVGKCPGPDSASESVYVHYSCDGGVTWHLLHTLLPAQHKEPRQMSVELPGGARGPGCRFQIWQDQHSGAGRDIWAIDDLTITSRLFNNIQLDFSDPAAANNSLRFHLGDVESDVCGHDSALVFGDTIATDTMRFVETKSIGVGPSYMIQFDLVIGCGEGALQDTPNKVVLEYSLNHGISWRLVHRPCSPSTPGCQTYYTQGTVYHPSEFSQWKRVTVRLPQHTWSPSTRLRLRQTEDSEVGESWAVDNLYVGLQCPGLCSGHGHCTNSGCRCDDNFHGHKCLPIHKLHREMDATFDQRDDVARYSLQVTGGRVVSPLEGCGVVLSNNSLYFGAQGVRQLETDDLNTEDLEVIQFLAVVGGGATANCVPAPPSSSATPQQDSHGHGSVVLEASTDGGQTWTLIQELLPSEYRVPRVVRAHLDEELVNASSGVVRFRVWQPTHGERDQWAVDNIRISPNVHLNSVQADFAPNSLMASPWLSVTGSSTRDYCQTQDDHPKPAQVMDGTEPVREAVTNPLKLKQGDIIAFKISVGCDEGLVSGEPVLLEYSRDGGMTWSLVHPGCPTAALHCHGPSEPSVYRPGHHGPWTRVLLPVDHRLAQGSVQLRWMQKNPDEMEGGEFGLRDLYIGPPCLYACHGHGICTAANLCKCDPGYEGNYCGKLPEKNSKWMEDKFESGSLSAGWDRTEGSSLVAQGCGPQNSGPVLLFSASGPRSATTKEMDTRFIKFLVFNLQIGSSEAGGRCQIGEVPRDNVVLEYSTDNAQTWSQLQQFEAPHTTNRKEAFFIPLPNEARTRHTRFRWWQAYNGMLMGDDSSVGERAEWHLDNVMVLANESLPTTLSDNMDGNSSSRDPWFLQQGASVTPACGSEDNVLLFSGAAAPRYAETWDFQGSESTVVQFEINMGCVAGSANSEVALQYSTDNGLTWRLVREVCAPPEVECGAFHLSSTFSPALHPAWTRFTAMLPKDAVGERVRLRVTEVGEGTRAASWALNNFFVGDSCPWMCSGHGTCSLHSCSCDEGYFGAFCVPAAVLPCELLDTFDRVSEVNDSRWQDVHGAEVSQRCGVIISKSALVFFKDGLRLATTIDLDMTAGQFVQFNLVMGCEGRRAGRAKRSNLVTRFEDECGDEASSDYQAAHHDRQYGILVQYSSDGGISWHLVKEIHFRPQPEPEFVSIDLSAFPRALTNATRFRVWQPHHGGITRHTWAIDNLFIGGSPVTPNVLYDDFNKGTPAGDAWVDWPAGDVGQMCDELDSSTGLVFSGGEGERALYTRDLHVDADAVVQFDIRVGCGQITAQEHNVSLQYSTDLGATWTTLRPSQLATPDCYHELNTPTVFYPNSARRWTRVVVPLTHLQICGRVRFRWWQGRYGPRETGVVWGIDNVYIGPSCVHHCGGHGYCINGDTCICDDNYAGNDTCILIRENSRTLNEDFENGVSGSSFKRWSGAEVSSFCGVLTGEALVFSQQGERMLVTEDLDLTQGSVVQFYIRFGCMDVSPGLHLAPNSPVLLQYSSDGGITWSLMAELSHPPGPYHTKHHTLTLPEMSKSNGTRLRWWQPSQDGSFASQWAIDQIHIGNTAEGLPAFSDVDTGLGWLLRPGSVHEPVCGLPHSSLHFTSRDGYYRMAETPDIMMSERTFIQFTASLACKEGAACYSVDVEYSVDHGASWSSVRGACLPSQPECTEYWANSSMVSDLYVGSTPVTLTLPMTVRSELGRVRWVQRAGWKQQQTWALSHVYVGDECINLCSGRGLCEAGVCHCGRGWTGESCHEPTEPLPTFLTADFEEGEAWEDGWRRVVGGQTGDHCGPLAAGHALHFLGGCSRYLETQDLDLRGALFVEFDVRSGCADPVSGGEAGGDHSVLLQASCDAGISWNTLKKLLLVHHQPKFVWVKLPESLRCEGGRVRWWQPVAGERGRYDWAVDGVIVGGSVDPPDTLTYTHPHHLTPPLWLRRYNALKDQYCDHGLPMYVMMSTPSEPALLQTTDLQIGEDHVVSFMLALGCGSPWDSNAPPVRLEYTVDFGYSWQLVREMCLLGNRTCDKIADASVFYAPLKWNRYVYFLKHIGPAKYVRFRWIQAPTSDVSNQHQWSLRDVYIGKACPHHCLGRGSCLEGVCVCDHGYTGLYCQYITIDNVPYIRDQFSGPEFLPHFTQVQGGLLSEGCGGLEEPPTATFQGPNTRTLLTRPVDTRSAKFVHFIAQIGSIYGNGVCRAASHRTDNVLLQYSVDGGINWHLLRELDYNLYTTPSKEYILIPPQARTPATVFRFWQPRLNTPPPAWSLDDLFIGGSEISAAYLMDKFEGEPTVSEWLFAPHSQSEVNYCSSGTNGSLVWGTHSPGHREITTQELIIQEGHILQFKVSVGCGERLQECRPSPGVRLEYSREGGVLGWDLVRDSCLPGSSPDPDCQPYTFHPQSIFRPDTHSHWRRVTIPLPEKTWGSTTQLRWVQEEDSSGGGTVTPWSLDDVYVGRPCPHHCHGRGDCVEGACVCDPGYLGELCTQGASRGTPLPTTLLDGFEGGVGANWALVTGGGVGLGCSSLAPHAHGKHLYFSGCGTRQATTVDLDTRTASKLMFVLRIGSHDHTPSCHVDLSEPQRALDKGVVLQYSPDNGVTWVTINVHDPLDFRKARRVAYSLPVEARRYGVQLRWWQPDHDGASTDQWALDNVEVVLAQRRDTSRYEAQTFHESEL